ncbi:uncharacterized protein FA14DRAFT_159801 [Meira miltonrushii]|uniref:Histone-lysine N-methyltransferase, H3 lysine-4 specific n=1 Tax=Meira miltonrushii TaxID=1280837 RepID=A0A316VKC2_9BASI|nr:uncharacterized protein FA14DRAFT_159801 [Meira miltonrushii]PWN38042.1 hypothetical protein FA14DRAFT_159801 [Meira miltonrushii]
MIQRNAVYPYEDKSWPSTARDRSPSYRSRAAEDDYASSRAGPSRYHHSEYERRASNAYDDHRSYSSREGESRHPRTVNGYDSTSSRYRDEYDRRSGYSESTRAYDDLRRHEDIKEHYRRRTPSPPYRSSRDWENSNGRSDYRDDSSSRYQRSARPDGYHRDDVYRPREHYSTPRSESRVEEDRHADSRSSARYESREARQNGKSYDAYDYERSAKKSENSLEGARQNGTDKSSHRSVRRAAQEEDDDDGLQQLWSKSNGRKESPSRDKDRRASGTPAHTRDRRPIEKPSLASKVLEEVPKRGRGDLSNASDRQEYVQDVRRHIEMRQKDRSDLPVRTEKTKTVLRSFPEILLPHELLLPENAQHLPSDAKGEKIRSTRISYDPELDKEKDKKGKRVLYHDLTKEVIDPRNSAVKGKSRKELRLFHWKWDDHSTKSKPPPPPRSLVISGLSPMTVVTTVKRFFASFGRIDECEIKMDTSGMSTGVCYLSFHHDYDDDLKLVGDVSEAKAQRGDLVAKEARLKMNGQKIEMSVITIAFDDLDRTTFKKTYRDLLQKKIDAVSQKKEASTQSPAPASTPSMPPPGAPRGPKTMISRNGLTSPKPLSPFAHGSRHTDVSRRTSHDETDKDEIHTSGQILRQLVNIGTPFAYVNRARGSTIGCEAMEKLFADMRPAWIKRDGSGFYVAFHQTDGADRAKKVLDGTSVSGYRISIEVRSPNDERSNRINSRRTDGNRRSESVDQRAEPVQSIPEKTAWTDEELFEDSKSMLLRELGIAFGRDLKSRILSSFVTKVLEPEGSCGKALRQPVKSINEQIEEEFKIDLDAERPKSFNRAAKEERRLKLAQQKREEEEAAKRALAKANQPSSDEEEEEEVVTKETKAKQKKVKAKKEVKVPKPQKKIVYSPSPEPIDPFVSGLVEEEEDLYFCRLALEMMREGQDPQELPDEDEPKEEALQSHASGSARTEGFYRIPPAEKGKHLADRNMASSTEWGSTTAVSTVGLASARDNRADSRRFVQGIEQHKKETATDTDILKFNQLRSRKKQLKFAKSPIHDWGLYAMEAIPAGDMVIEYVGEIVRQQVADEREKMYERQGNFSTYLFRVDDDIVVDATKKGNIARLMNHCCTPNCNAKILTLNGEKRIVLYAKQLILPGQELTYDYKFQASGDEEDAIACLCGSPGCRRFL